MNINEKAIEMFEQNKYEEANDEKALELIREVVKLNPSSYFPYNILGEIYI